MSGADRQAVERRTRNMQPARRASHRMYQLTKDGLDNESPNLLDNCPPKPRWMRWRTFQRLAAIDEALEDRRLLLLPGGFYPPSDYRYEQPLLSCSMPPWT